MNLTTLENLLNKPENLRLKCLELAITHLDIYTRQSEFTSPPDVFELAKQFIDYVDTGHTPNE